MPSIGHPPRRGHPFQPGWAAVRTGAGVPWTGIGIEDILLRLGDAGIRSVHALPLTARQTVVGVREVASAVVEGSVRL
jgi:hypothetical protein